MHSPGMDIGERCSPTFLNFIQMHNFQIVIFLLAVRSVLSRLIERIKVPQPILLVVAGLLIGFIPALPDLGT